ncbi:hypothetical protein [Methylobacterium sp. E-045]|uniref:hypothetical protein n=1 Tax=Methylobacterium sp. E-045 TaxID=2836575 RepID=UPI001FBA3875|nr:hypothetical protein [Methylobacterium sp. E-045]MCJ2127295.1 hypothetical protein [Methylobacterium sp. E-045]
MATSKIDAVMRLNANIVATEARFSNQVARLVEVFNQGKDTAREEEVLASYMTSLTVLRSIRDRLLNGSRFRRERSF